MTLRTGFFADHFGLRCDTDVLVPRLVLRHFVAAYSRVTQAPSLLTLMVRLLALANDARAASCYFTVSRVRPRVDMRGRRFRATSGSAVRHSPPRPVPPARSTSRVRLLHRRHHGGAATPASRDMRFAANA